MIASDRDPRILALCREYGEELTETGLNGAALLYALFRNEHYNRTNDEPRYEPTYDLGGRWCPPAQAARVAKWGQAACCSYSNWQIMFPVACELGYKGSPAALDDDDTALPWVVRLLNRRLVPLCRKNDGIVTVAEVADAYNTGNPRDSLHNFDYETRAVQHYAEGLTLFV